MTVINCDLYECIFNSDEGICKCNKIDMVREKFLIFNDQATCDHYLDNPVYELTKLGEIVAKKTKSGNTTETGD